MTDDSKKLPKFATLERVIALLTSTQKDSVDDLARQIMRFRSRSTSLKEDRERITANTVYRALVDNFISRLDLLKMVEIQNEEELKEWIGLLFKSRNGD